MIFLFSYEGTGRSLSLKLLQQLRSQAVPIGNNANDKSGQNAITGRFLKEVSFIMLKTRSDWDTLFNSLYEME